MPTVLEYYLRLYFHHVHDRYPVIHLSTFDINQTAPLLLATMMLAGSSHSKADRGRFCNLFYGPIRTAIMKKVDVDGSYLRTVDNIFTFLLLCLCGTWSGDKQAYEFAEGSRGILVTASRRCRLMDCRPNRLIPTLRQFTMLEAAWRSWIEAERRKRLGLSIYVSRLLAKFCFLNANCASSTIVNIHHFSITSPTSLKRRPRIAFSLALQSIGKPPIQSRGRCLLVPLTFLLQPTIYTHSTAACYHALLKALHQSLKSTTLARSS